MSFGLRLLELRFGMRVPLTIRYLLPPLALLFDGMLFLEDRFERFEDLGKVFLSNVCFEYGSRGRGKLSSG